jgi:hypothetical protein
LIIPIDLRLLKGPKGSVGLLELVKAGAQKPLPGDGIAAPGISAHLKTHPV